MIVIFLTGNRLRMLNFNQSDTNTNFSCQMADGGGGPEDQTSTAVPSAFSDQQQHQDSQQPSYPLMASFSVLGTNTRRNSSPSVLHQDRFFENSVNSDGIHQTTAPDTMFPFLMPSAKGSENVKRFSVNNLLQLAQCTTSSNLMSSARVLGEFINL